MGCCSIKPASKSAKSKRRRSLPVVVRKKDSTTSTESTSNHSKNWFKSFSAVLYDPDGCYTDQKPLAESMFHNAVFLENPASLYHIIDTSSCPFVVVSAAEHYEDIKETVEGKPYVVGVFILAHPGNTCTNLREAPKVLEVSSSIDFAAQALLKTYSDYTRFVRFFDNTGLKSFYGVEDKHSVLSVLSMAAQRGKFTLFFPLGIKAIHLPECLSDAVLGQLEASSRAFLSAEDRETLANSIATLKEDNSLENVLRAYTVGGLCKALTVGLRQDEIQGFELFKNYIFCLKGGMCEKGKPILDKGKVVYRGLKLKREAIEEYKAKKGEIVLLAGFTPTTLKEDIVKRFINEQNTDEAVMEITITEHSEEFNEKIKHLGFPEENGVFFPIDISSYSIRPSEAEILFPPFYPIKIIEVRPKQIIAQAPCCVNVAGKDWESNIRKAYSTENVWNKAYLQTVLRFVKTGLTDKLSIVKMDILQHHKMFDKLLEVIKREIRIQTVILEYEILGDEHVKELVRSGLLSNPSLKHLSLGSNIIGADGAKEIGMALRKNSTLTSLNLNNNCIGIEGGKQIGLALIENDTLTTIDLTENKIVTGGITCIGLALKRNKKLAELHLSYNHIENEGARQLASALTENHTLSLLDIHNCNISLEGGKCIGAALKGNKGLRRLDLSYNEIGAEGAEAIGEALKENVMLEDLNINKNTIGIEGAQAIGAALKENKTLTKLELWRNYIGAEGGRQISQALVMNTSLVSLDLGYNNIGEIGGIEIGQVLKRNRTLCNLYLSDNNIGAKGGKQIGLALKANKIGFNNIGDEGAKAIAAALKVNTTLSTLDLYSNSINDEGAKQIGAALEKNTGLSTLDLSSNNIRLIGGKSIGHALRYNQTLNTFNLRYNHIGDEGAREIALALKGNTALTSMDLSVNSISADVRKLFDFRVEFW